MRPLDPRLLRRSRPALGGVIATVALGVLTAVVVIVQAFALAGIIARAFLESATVADLQGPLLVLAGCVLIRTVMAWGLERATLGASAGVKADLRQQLLSGVVESGRDAVGSGGTATLTQVATRGLDALDSYFARYLPQLVLAVLLPLAILGTIWPVDRLAFVTIALTLPLIPIFMALVGMATEASNRRRWNALARLGHHFLDVVQGMSTLKLFGRGPAQAEAVRRVTEAYRVETMGTLRIAFLSSLVLELLATLSVALVAVGVGLRLAEGGLALETGLLVLILAPEAYLPLRMVGTHYHASAEGLAAAEQALDLLPDPPVHALGGALVGRPQAVVFEDVGAAQSGRALTAPNALTAIAAAGTVTALVGASGSGKSTALMLVLGLRAPTTGRVRVVDQDGATLGIDDLDRRSWWDRVAWVPQEPVLVAGTVEDNVRWGAPDADPSVIEAALAVVGLTAGHRLLPEGSGTVLGERSGVSAGQRRRIAVARALVRRADVVLLDEPTAGLDAVTEDAIVRALRREADRGAIVIAVAHRESILAVADQRITVTATATAAASDPAGGTVGVTSAAASAEAALVEAMTP